MVVIASNGNIEMLFLIIFPMGEKVLSHVVKIVKYGHLVHLFSNLLSHLSSHTMHHDKGRGSGGSCAAGQKVAELQSELCLLKPGTQLKAQTPH